MSAYTGYLIRRERLAQNLSQEGLCKGICAASYLSKIESGSAEPGEEIIDRLFAALGIEFVRDAKLLGEAQQTLNRFFFLMDADEPCDTEKAFFEANRERLARSEFALRLSVFDFVAGAQLYNREETLSRLARIEPFMESLALREMQWVLLVKAEYMETPQEEWAVLERAARLGPYSLVSYKQAKLAFQQGWYSRCVELGERAYAQAAEEGSAATMISSTFLLGSCMCNRCDMALAKRYYDRVRALTRGHRINMDDYIAYNLGSTYLELGEDEQALSLLEAARETKNDAAHNILLNQKLSILYQRLGKREKGLAHLSRAKECFSHVQWDAAWDATRLMQQMIRFAELTFDEAAMEQPEFECVTRLLYDEAGARFGFGFKRFYGRYLLELYKSQRRYKDALRVREEMEMNDLS